MPTTTATAPAAASPAVLSGRGRLVSLDVFRGATIMGMILVNNPGTWAAVYPPLRHAEWHGWTPTDLIFPFFLFIVGVAIAYAYTKRLAKGAERADLVQKAAVRSAILFGLGLLMAAFPFLTFAPEVGLHADVTALRIMGVLQRIAICYFAASLIFLFARPKVQHLWTVGLLLAYWLLMTLVPVPGYGAGQLDDPRGTLAAYLDRLILQGHLWAGADYLWDPEGLLSTIPAIATTLLGVWTGRLLLGEEDAVRKAARLFARGVVLVIVGYVWSWFFPINKSIWTSSYAVFTGGQAMCALALCYWIIDVNGHRRWTRPFVIYGINAITVYVLSGLLAELLIYIRVPGADGTSVSLQRLLFENVFLALASPINASLLYALTWIAGWYLVLWWMYKRNLVIKV